MAALQSTLTTSSSSSFSFNTKTPLISTNPLPKTTSFNPNCSTLFSRSAAVGSSRSISNLTAIKSRKSINPIKCSSSSLTPEMKSALDNVVKSQKVVLFMKGTKDFPMCGFSNTVVQILKSVNVPFETINILDNEMLRQGLKVYSSWPTFPQLYIDGEFFGGCDITVEAYKSGELQEVLEKAICS